MSDFLEIMAQPGPQEVTVAGRLLRPGSRVVLRPERGRDTLDTDLAGKVAIIEGIGADDAGVAHLAVVIEEDPTRGLGLASDAAHRFFFHLDEVEPLDEHEEPFRRVLVACVGNVFHGDDGFGVAVAQRLLQRDLPKGVDVIDFGIRAADLAYALTSGYDAVIVVDAVPCRRIPGNLSIIEPAHLETHTGRGDLHQMDPLAVLQHARTLGELPSQLLIVGCEPKCHPAAGADPVSMELSEPVVFAVDPAADLVAELAGRLLTDRDLGRLLL